MARPRRIRDGHPMVTIEPGDNPAFAMNPDGEVT